METDNWRNSAGRQQNSRKRLEILVHDAIPEDFIQKVRDVVATIRFASVKVADYAAEDTISVTFNGVAQKPMIYVDPKEVDELFLANIEQNSIVLTQESINVRFQAKAALYSINLLPLHPTSVSSALQFVLEKNHILGTGFPVVFYGDTWKEILTELPNIGEKHAEAIVELAKNRDQFLEVFGSGTKKGIPQKVIDTVMTFLTTPDPDVTLVKPRKSKKRLPSD